MSSCYIYDFILISDFVRRVVFGLDVSSDAIKNIIKLHYEDYVYSPDLHMHVSPGEQLCSGLVRAGVVSFSSESQWGTACDFLDSVILKHQVFNSSVFTAHDSVVSDIKKWLASYTAGG